MGTIKFEIDLPEFENELSLELTIKRDGKVVVNKKTTTSPPSSSKPTKKTSDVGGNMMNLEI